MKYPEDVRYLAVWFNYTSTFSECLYNSNNEFVSGYTDGEDEPCLLPQQFEKHLLSPSGKSMVIDLITGKIINWKPPEEATVKDFLDEMFVLASEEAGL